MKNFTALTALTLFILACENEKKVDPYLVQAQNIGLLTDSTKVLELEDIFFEDSIVRHIKGDEFMGSANDIDVYSKNGDKLLTLSPVQVMDSTSVIKNIQIHNEIYKTGSNISTLSTFKDIRDSYKINSISNLINSIVISVDEINATFTIDKKELPANLRYDMSMKIEKSQIPDNAKIKYFMLYWN